MITLIAGLAAVLAVAMDAGSADADGTPITDVTVYTDRALVTRRGTAACQHGSAHLTFPALPPSVDPASLHAHADGGHVIALRWDQAPPRATDIDDRLRQARQRLAGTRRRLERASRAAQRTDGYDQLTAAWAAQSLWRPGSSPETWAAGAEALLDERLAVERERGAAEADLRKYKDEEAALVLEHDARAAKPTRGAITAEVTLACEPAMKTLAVALRYLAVGASWRPAYEVRADGKTTTIDLTSYAAVRQWTGESWDDVHLTLSTAQPGEAATPPELRPAVVTAHQSSGPPILVSGTQEIEREAIVAQIGMNSSAAAGPRPADDLPIDLPIPGLVQVTSQGDEVRLRAAHTRQTAHLRLRAVPRLAAAAFWIGDIVNSNPFPLLPGTIDIYRDGVFVGTQSLPEPLPCRAPLLISFGTEEAVDIGRIPLREVERQAGLLGRDSRHEFAYRFQVQSRLPSAQEVEILDHIPVSEIQQVKVALDPATTAGYALDARDGLVTWRLPLRPGEEKTVDLAYRVEVPHEYAR